ncbi:MAG: hypothetical protein ACT4P3_21400 [Betaproteobacteria bacterium]
MKLTLSTLLALALSGALLAGCDRPADGGRAASGGSGKMGEAATGGTPKEKQQDPRTTPKPPSKY